MEVIDMVCQSVMDWQWGLMLTCKLKPCLLILPPETLACTFPWLFILWSWSIWHLDCRVCHLSGGHSVPDSILERWHRVLVGLFKLKWHSNKSKWLPINSCPTCNMNSFGITIVMKQFHSSYLHQIKACHQIDSRTFVKLHLLWKDFNSITTNLFDNSKRTLQQGAYL